MIRGMTIPNYNKLNKLCVSYLKTALKELDIVITHHMPSKLKYTEDVENNGSFENEYLISTLYLNNKLLLKLKNEDEILVQKDNILKDMNIDLTIKDLCKLIDFSLDFIDDK